MEAGWFKLTKPIYLRVLFGGPKFEALIAGALVRREAEGLTVPLRPLESLDDRARSKSRRKAD